MSDIQPFTLAVPQARLDDLRERLARTRWPEPETVATDGSRATTVGSVRDKCRIA